MLDASTDSKRIAPQRGERWVRIVPLELRDSGLGDAHAGRQHVLQDSVRFPDLDEVANKASVELHEGLGPTLDHFLGLHKFELMALVVRAQGTLATWATQANSGTPQECPTCQLRTRVLGSFT